MSISAFKDSTANGGYIHLNSSKTDTVGGQGLITNGSQLGSIFWNASDGVGYIRAAAISATISGSTGVNDMPTSLSFGTTANGASAPTTRLTISDTGLATFANAVTTTGLLTASSGINLGQDTLNYYDEGTFTATISCDTAGDLGVAYSTQKGNYTRVGNIVTVFFSATFTPTFTTASGSLRLLGLPFVVNVTPAGGMVCANSSAGITYSSGYTQLVGYGEAGASYLRVREMGSTKNGSRLAITSMVSGVENSLTVVGSYIV